MTHIFWFDFGIADFSLPQLCNLQSVCETDTFWDTSWITFRREDILLLGSSRGGSSFPDLYSLWGFSVILEWLKDCNLWPPGDYRGPPGPLFCCLAIMWVTASCPLCFIRIPHWPFLFSCLSSLIHLLISSISQSIFQCASYCTHLLHYIYFDPNIFPFHILVLPCSFPLAYNLIV